MSMIKKRGKGALIGAPFLPVEFRARHAREGCSLPAVPLNGKERGLYSPKPGGPT